MNKKLISFLLSLGMATSCMPCSAIAEEETAELAGWSNTQGSSQDNGNGTYNNPVLFTDVADPDVIRANDAYYLVSTAMQYSPGAPIMKSYDLVNWETVNYIYDTLDYTDDALRLKNGKDAYGWGQWATALKYNNGKFYALFSSYTTGKSYIYETDDIENGRWKKSVFDVVFHDPSFIFDDDGKVYVFFGQNGEYIAEVVRDDDGYWKLTDEDLEKQKNGEQIGTKIIDNMGAYLDDGTTDFVIAGEGVHAYKIDGRYYIIFISWPCGSHWKRLMACYRSIPDENGVHHIDGEYEGKLIMEETLDYAGGEGIAQGGMCSLGDVNTPYDKTVDDNGNPITWKGIIYQDRGPVGRTPMLVDVTWEDGWPMMSAVRSGEKPIKGYEQKSLTVSDEFNNDNPRRDFTAITKETETAVMAEVEEIEYISEETAVLAEETVINNGDMEWVDSEGGVGYWGATEIDSVKNAAVISSDEAHTGNRSLYVYDRDSNETGAMQYVSVTPDKEYVAKAYVKYDEGEEAPESETFKIELMNNYWQPVEIGSVTVSAGEWGEISGGFVAPSDFGGGFVKVTSEKSNVSFYLDDVTIDEKPEATEEPNPTPKPGEPIAPEEINIINNGGFENGVDDYGVPNWWHDYNGATVSISDKFAASGSYSAKLSNRPEGGSGAGQYIDLIPGKSYKVSFKVYYESGNGAPQSEKFTFALSNNWVDAYPMATGKVKADTWTTITGTFTVPKDFDGGQVYTVADSSMMDYYIDDVSIVLQRAVGDEIIENGGFETGNTSAWASREGACLETVGMPYAGGYSAYVSGRNTSGAGPWQDVTGKIKPGRKYDVSMWLKYDEGPDEKQFNLTIEHRGANGEVGYTSLKDAKFTKGEWGEISGVVEIPKDIYTNEIYVYVENPWTPTPTADDTMDFYIDNVSMIELPKEVVEPAEYEYNGSNLNLAWQWNHNPDNRYWSLTDRPGYLRLTTGSIVDNIQKARNTLTQRTFGPQCSGWVKMDISGMKKGDFAGMSTMQVKYGNIGVKMYDDGSKHFVWQYIKEQAYDSNEINDDNWRTIDPAEVDLGAIDSNISDVYLKLEYDFHNYDNVKADSTAYFYYSVDGINWTYAGELTGLYYHLYQFTGYKFALFNYATKRYGGYVDFDYFRVEEGRTSEKSNTVLNVSVEAPTEVDGVPGTEIEARINVDALPNGDYTSMEAAMNIPENTEVTGVEFNTANITGNYSYEVKNGVLTFRLTGDNVGFENNNGKLFATVKLRVTDFVTNESKFPKDEEKLKADKVINIIPSYVVVDGKTGDGNEVEYGVSGAEVALKFVDFGAVSKFPGNGNTLMSHRYGADPFAMEYDGRLYIYMSSDAYEYDDNGNLITNDYANIKSISVISTDDMVNWVDHGEIPVAGSASGPYGDLQKYPGLENGAAKWAANSWAPSVCHKTIDGVEKFFLYFGNNGSSIGVLEGDSPVGPFYDPTVSEEYPDGHPLITGETPGMESRQAWMFDPAVFVDDDGQGYLYFGGGIPNDGTDEAQTDHPKTASVIKLGDDMTSTVGEAVEIDAPAMLEDSGIHKYGNKYYYSYCTNFSGEHENNTIPYGGICYMVSDSPMGPFEYSGEVLSNMYNFFRLGGNNHHAIFNYKGEWYITYHSQIMSGRELEVNETGSADGMGYRSSHVEKIKIYSDGTIEEIEATRKGAPQIKALNPFTINEAETIAWQKGISVSNCDEEGVYYANYNRKVDGIDNGDWLAVSNADFGNGAQSFTAKVKSEKSGTVDIYIDSPNGEKIGTLAVDKTDGEFKNISCTTKAVSGVHNIFFVFSGEGENIMELDTWKFDEIVSEFEVLISEAKLSDNAVTVKTELSGTLPQDAVMYIAVYENERLTAVKKLDEVGEVTIETSGDRVGLLVWNNNTQKPICDAVKANINK